MPSLPSSKDADATMDSVIAQFEEMTLNAARIQEETLQSILKQNSATEYLKSCDLQGRTDARAFKQRVPIVSRHHLKSCFDRIADGDRSPILTTEPVHTLSLSSGTTSDGEQKYLILYKEILEASVHIKKLSAAYRARAFPIKSSGRSLDLVFLGKLSKTRGWLTSATATTHMFRSQEFRSMRQQMTQARSCSPEQVAQASDNREAMYCHLLCGLLFHEDVQFINSTFAYTIAEALRTLERQWPSLCHDIRIGQLSAWIKEPALRNALAKLLKTPNPELADTLVDIFSSMQSCGWQGVVPALWPNCQYVYAIMTGSMTTYVKRLEYYAADLPLVSGDYGATESWIAVNTNPKAHPSDATFTVVPWYAYFEFIPLQQNTVEQSQDQKDLEKTVGLTEVEVGREYEIVLTTYGGLYRYRLGDVVRVTGFFNSSPQLAFVCRRNVVLTVNIDKNSEMDLQIAIDKGLEVLHEEENGGNAMLCGRADSKVGLVDYTSYADLSTAPGHYVIFCELDEKYTTGGVGVGVAQSLLGRCATTVDEAFVDPGYVGCRKVGSIGPLELCVVEAGTFQSLLDRYLMRGAAITQYKTPRCISSSSIRDIMRARTVSTAFSTAYMRQS